MLGYCWCQVAHNDFWRIYSMLWILDTLISIGYIKNHYVNHVPLFDTMRVGGYLLPPLADLSLKIGNNSVFYQNQSSYRLPLGPYQKLMTTHYVNIKRRSSQDNSWKPKWTAHFWLRKTWMFLFGFNGAPEGHCTNATLLSPNLSPYLPRAEY